MDGFIINNGFYLLAPGYVSKIKGLAWNGLICLSNNITRVSIKENKEILLGSEYKKNWHI